MQRALHSSRRSEAPPISSRGRDRRPCRRGAPADQHLPSLLRRAAFQPQEVAIRCEADCAQALGLQAGRRVGVAGWVGETRASERACSRAVARGVTGSAMYPPLTHRCGDDLAGDGGDPLPRLALHRGGRHGGCCRGGGSGGGGALVAAAMAAVVATPAAARVSTISDYLHRLEADMRAWERSKAPGLCGEGNPV